MKKVLISIISVIVIIAILITGKKYWNEYRVEKDVDQVEKMVYGEEVKTELEYILKLLDRKALTPEGKIKSYKIDESYTKNNPMGGIIVRVIINDDPELDVETTLNKYPSRGKLEHGVILRSQKMGELVPPKRKLNEGKSNG